MRLDHIGRSTPAACAPPRGRGSGVLRPTRRQAILSALAAAAAPGAASAQAYPDRPIRIVVPYVPGGTTDLLARMLGERLSRDLGQPVVVENRSGAGGGVGSELAARAAPDGYTLLFGNLGPIALNPTLYARLPYDPEKDFAPIGRVADFPLILVVPASLDVTSVPQLIDYARRDPGGVNFASVGNGSVSHLAGEMLNRAAGLRMTHVPYRGGAQAFIDVLAGAAQVYFATGIEARPHIEAGRVRPLAITSPKRSPVAPDLPTLRELGFPEFDIVAWFGLLAPAGTPAPVMARLSSALRSIMALPDVRRAVLDVSAEPVVDDTPERFSALISAEIRRWAPIIRAAGVRIE